MRTHITAMYRRKPISVPVESITHCEAGDKYVTIHYREDGHGKALITDEVIERLAAEFPSMIRVHRSRVVNASLVQSMKRDINANYWLALKGVPVWLAVSRRHRLAVKSLLASKNQ